MYYYVLVKFFSSYFLEKLITDFFFFLIEIKMFFFKKLFSLFQNILHYLNWIKLTIRRTASVCTTNKMDHLP